MSYTYCIQVCAVQEHLKLSFMPFDMCIYVKGMYWYPNEFSDVNSHHIRLSVPNLYTIVRELYPFKRENMSLCKYYTTEVLHTCIIVLSS